MKIVTRLALAIALLAFAAVVAAAVWVIGFDIPAPTQRIEREIPHAHSPK